VHTIDIIFAVIGVIFIIIGIKRGLTGEIIRVVAMVLGFIIALLYFSEITPYFSVLKVPQHIINALAFFIVYAIVALLILLAGWLIKKAINLTPFGWVDRILGGCVGVFKTVLIAWVVCLSISSFQVKRLQGDLSHSIIYSTYKKLPPNLHLKAVLATKEAVRSLLRIKSTEGIDNKKAILESISNKADSVHNKKSHR
jgi:uncharacterized membrane protein required for colicin V production